MPDQYEQIEPRRGIMRSKPVLWLGLLLMGFLLGFFWQYTRARRLETELGNLRQIYDSCQERSRLSDLRDAISFTHFEAIRKNYGLASERSTLFFDQLRALLETDADPKLKENLGNLLSSRDRVTAGLASGDPAIVETLQDLLLKTFQSTKVPDGRVGE